jgi:hypothetical protein
MPSVLQLLRRDLQQHFDGIVERLVQQLQDVLLIRSWRFGRVEIERWLYARDLVEAVDIACGDMHHLLTERHLVGIRFEVVEVGGHGFGHVDGELLGDLPVMDKFRYVENGIDFRRLGRGERQEMRAIIASSLWLAGLSEPLRVHGISVGEGIYAANRSFSCCIHSRMKLGQPTIPKCRPSPPMR